MKELHRKGIWWLVVLSLGLTTVEGELTRVVGPEGQVHFPGFVVIVKVEIRFLTEG